MKINLFKIKLLLLSCLLLGGYSAKSVTFTVDNLGDVDNLAIYTLGDGTNTLRKCIRLANTNANTPIVDIISFANVPGVGPYVISCLNNLPSITDPLDVNGYTAPGHTPFIPIMAIRGAGAAADPSPMVNSFTIIAGGIGSFIRGFALYRTTADGIYINNVLNITVEGCWVGLNETGALPANANSRIGVHGIVLIDGANNCSIGASNVNGRNIIAGTLGHGVLVVNSSGAIIRNNYIGTNVSGAAAIPNTFNGINIDNSLAPIIGGNGPYQQNVISGNTGTGILIANASSNAVIRGNYIGTNATGNAAVANGQSGINIFGSSLSTIIGGVLSGQGNLVSGNINSGIIISGGSNNPSIKGNKIGINLAGNAALPNIEVGLNIYDNVLNAVIGGSLLGEGNIISGNGSHGINIDIASHGASIKGNLVGVNATGLSSIPNRFHGINILLSNTITIGGSTKLERNIISGNGVFTAIPYAKNGISINSSNGNVIQGNFCGLGADGTTAIPNFDTGISISTSTGNTIGGTNYLQRNVISGNNNFGLFLSNVDNTTFTQNYIGVDSTGAMARSNFVHGVQAQDGCNLNNWTNNFVSGNGTGVTGMGLNLLGTTNNTFYGNYIGLGINGITDLGNANIGFRLGDGSNNNIIGGAGSGQRNYISGNGDHGMMIDFYSTGNSVKGNYVGSDITGLIPVPNQSVGLLLLEEANSTIVGGSGANEGNLFCCSLTEPGIQINISNTNTLQGNLIGVNKDGLITPGFGNADFGIFIVSYFYLGGSSNNNTIGGLGAGERNIIANNGLDGVRLGIGGGSNGTNFNPIIGNSIYCNGGLGINLETNAANENQGVPAPNITLSNANITSGTGISGNTVHVYRNQSSDGARCDCEGEIYLGTTPVVAGAWSLAHNLSLTAAQALSVTATQTNATNSTSEFWVCSVPLPVEPIHLSATRLSNSTIVSFSVTKEEDIYLYNILRSLDGLTFEPIGSVIPKNNYEGLTTYQFEDDALVSGVVYYKIQTVENTGRIAHSKIIHVQTSPAVSSLYPNPAEDEVTIMSNEIIKTIDIKNVLGQTVILVSLNETEKVINLSGLASGVYFITLVTLTGENPEVYKLEKR